MLAYVVMRGSAQQMGRVLSFIPDAERLDIPAHRMAPLSQDHVVAALEVIGASNALSSSWLIRSWGSRRGGLPPAVEEQAVGILVQMGDEPGDSPLQGVAHLAKAVHSRGGATRLVARLEEDSNRGGVLARAVVDAGYWATTEGSSPERSRLRRRALRAVEVHAQEMAQAPRTATGALFSSLTPEDANWAASRLPGVARLLEHATLVHLRSADELLPCHKAVLPRVDIPWSMAGAAFLAAAMEHLSLFAGEDVDRWETSLTLLSDWNGTLRDLISAADTF